MMAIARIISGGQNGVDIAALRAAMSRGVPTGGVMPRGFLTLDGSKPEWAKEFGLTEHVLCGYPPRTRVNVYHSDITVRIALNFMSPGERCTLAAIRKYDRPHVDIRLYRHDGALCVKQDHILSAAEALADLASLLDRPIVVNFAGNSEQTTRGIEVFAEGVVTQIIDAVKQQR